MPLSSIAILGALVLVRLASGLAFDGPKPTPSEKIAAYAGISPRPTGAPEAQHVELFKRDLALPRTCGWLFDAKVSRSSVFACGVGTCAYYSSSGTAAQGCCSGLSTCVMPTTCYDYAQYTASSCGLSCQNNSANLVCSRSFAGKCQTYYIPAKGVTGYGCDTDTESTRTTIYTTFVSTPLASTALPVTLSAALFIAPRAALSTGTTTTFASTRQTVTNFFGTTTTSRSTGGTSYNGYNYDNNPSVGPGAIIIIVVIVLVWVIPGLCALGLLIWLCRRHKRNMAKIDQDKAARAAGYGNGSRAYISTIPYTASNVVMPGSHQSGFYPPQDTNQAGFYANKVSPHSTQVYPVPTPSPPIQAGSPAPTYFPNGVPNTNSTYVLPPGQVYTLPPPGHAFSPEQQGYLPPPQTQPQTHQSAVSGPPGVSPVAPQVTQEIHELH